MKSDWQTTADQAQDHNLQLKHTKTEGWQAFSTKLGGISQKDFYDMMIKGLPADTTLKIEIADDGALNNIYYDQEEFFFDRTRDSDNSFACKGCHVEEAAQGKNINRIVHKNIFELFEKIDVETLSLLAGETGIYAWARLGFVPSQFNWDEIKVHVQKRLDFLEAESIPEDYQEKLQNILVQDDPKAYWDLIDIDYNLHGKKLGKLLTLEWDEEQFPEAPHSLSCGVCYEGILDLSDPDCKNRMENYTNITPLNACPKVAATRKDYAAT